MEQRQKHSKEFRDSLVKKVLSRGNRTVKEVCEDAGVSHRTAANWIYSRGTPADMKTKKDSNKWTAEQKLKALMETSSLSESELGAYLRKAGLFSKQLEEWKAEFLSLMNSTKKPRLAKDDRDQKIRSLEREILRKDKALAEASALLILQKKVNLIWGNNDEDEK